VKARNIVFARVVALCPTLASAEDTSGSLTTAFGAEGTTLDPTKYSAVDHYFISQMFEQLVRFDPDQKMVDWLAASWELQEEDGKAVIDVRLRPEVRFHNGDPLTSESVRRRPAAV
jgi:peptide/nickel transport system substrate-binding protein